VKIHRLRKCTHNLSLISYQELRRQISKFIIGVPDNSRYNCSMDRRVIPCLGNALTLYDKYYRKIKKVYFNISFSRRTLRRQHRVKVHTNFFFSLLVCAICAVLWEALIKHDRLITRDATKTRMHQNSVSCFLLVV
jgi:hypothetical protein